MDGATIPDVIMLDNMEKRISLSLYDAEHAYELALENYQEGCCMCDKIKGRLEKFIGPKRVRYIKNVVRMNPYNEKTLCTCDIK